MARSNSGWLPVQHGAWAMLVVPFVAGLVLLGRQGASLPLGLAPLFGAWLSGYFTFNALAVWLKAPPARRHRFRAPVVVYAPITAVLGLFALAAYGPHLLTWAPPYAVLIGAAVALAWQHRERSTLSGAQTTAAASLMTLVVTHPDALTVATSDAQPALLSTLFIWTYFFGTVLYVKTNIRERGNPAYYRASIGWHGAATLLAVAAWVCTDASAWWAPFFALCTLRAAVVPRRRPRVAPLQIGLLEAGFCLAALAILAFG